MDLAPARQHPACGGAVDDDLDVRAVFIEHRLGFQVRAMADAVCVRVPDHSLGENTICNLPRQPDAHVRLRACEPLLQLPWPARQHADHASLLKDPGLDPIHHLDGAPVVRDLHPNQVGVVVHRDQNIAGILVDEYLLDIQRAEVPVEHLAEAPSLAHLERALGHPRVEDSDRAHDQPQHRQGHAASARRADLLR